MGGGAGSAVGACAGACRDGPDGRRGMAAARAADGHATGGGKRGGADVVCGLIFLWETNIFLVPTFYVNAIDLMGRTFQPPSFLKGD